MKKNKKGSRKGKTLKRLKEEADSYFLNNDAEKANETCLKIISLYPKDTYGYLGIIRAKTNDYKTYLEDDALKTLKTYFDSAVSVASKNEKEKIKTKYNDYLDDCKEVENLKRLKKQIIGKELLKGIHLDAITFLNQNISTANSYRANGRRLTDGYDLVKGLFLIGCLIFNLMFRNYLLILTVPFGVFGLIVVYSFIDVNFFNKGKIKTEQRAYEQAVLKAREKVLEIKKEIKKIDDNLAFLNEQKNSTILKIPESFSGQIKEYYDNNEGETAGKLLGSMLNNNASAFSVALDEQTSLDVDSLLSNVKTTLKSGDDELSKYINERVSEKRKKQNEIIYMKKVSTSNVIMVILSIIISVLSITVVATNFYDINFRSFIIAVITGVVSTFFYNIITGKHGSLWDTINDNLISCVFNATLVYDLIYASITNELKLTYGFIQMPIIFSLVFVGLVSLVSLFKYKNLLKKLSK
ncbi:MAG: hypothetical protein U0M66_05195 [Bacilli bacterium]|nr:hypothetical protein [Bacilli bacterium]